MWTVKVVKLTDMYVLNVKCETMKACDKGFSALANLQPVQADPGNLSYKAAAIKSSLL